MTTDYRGAKTVNGKIRRVYTIKSLGEAEEVYPDCSVYWDRDGISEWAEHTTTSSLSVYADQNQVLTAMQQSSRSSWWYVEYRADPVPHWVDNLGIHYFNPDYCSGDGENDKSHRFFK